MGSLTDKIVCPKCKKNAVEYLRMSLDYKTIECEHCGYKKEFERWWGPWEEIVNKK